MTSEPCYKATVSGARLVRCAKPVVEHIDGDAYCAEHAAAHQVFLRHLAVKTLARAADQGQCEMLAERLGIAVTYDPTKPGMAIVPLNQFLFPAA